MRKYFDDGKKQKVPVLSWCECPENGALEQAIDVSSHPFVFHHVALMPDTHQGYGMPIGGVAALEDVVSPNMVGVDIACGMMAARLDINPALLSGNKLQDLMEEIRRTIPMGFNHQEDLSKFRQNAVELLDKHASKFGDDSEFSKHLDTDTVSTQLGTLGGGNHFIEIQCDENDDPWLMIHSGSRNIGKRICEKYNKIALELNTRQSIKLPNKNLACLPTNSKEGRLYLALLDFCMDFSFKNRECMMSVIFNAMEKIFKTTVKTLESINIHHNYAALEKHFSKEVWIHRKGATSAFKNEYGIIPGCMGRQSYIVQGKGKTDSFKSCSHGAGRVMSRTAARKNLSMKQFKKDMGDILFRCEKALLDESPMAYKKIETVMSEQKDLVKIVHELKPLAVEKG